MRGTLVSIACLFFANSSLAQTTRESVSAPISAPAPVRPYEPLRHFKGAGRYFVDEGGLIAIGVSLGALGVARNFDEEIADSHREQQRISSSINKIGNEYLGTGVPGVLLGGAFWIYGDLSEKPYHAHAGQAQLETMLLTGLATSAIKGLANRERPDGSDRYSFPSGHTSTVFASASALQMFYGWKAGVIGYSLGALTAFSRISDNRHWLSDTVAGAALGILVGRAISKSHLAEFSGESEAQSNVRVIPVITNESAQAVVHISF